MIGEKTSVLIVDDEHLVCDLLHDELSDHGYLCIIAYDGKEALKKLETHDFEVILLDIGLPDINGIEVLEKIRSNKPDTAAIMITAVSDTHIAVKAMKLGASDYIVKPLDLDRVNESIHEVLETKKHFSVREDSQTVSDVWDNECDKQTVRESSTQIDAIARGVRAKHDLFTGYSKIINQLTINTARQLDMPENEIQRWAAVQSRRNSEKYAKIHSLLKRLESKPLARIIMSIPLRYTKTPSESMN